jgi:divalent metal cation (Fe/Co/Zn/Cd) transporter
LIKVWQSRFYKKTSRLINSKTLEATSQDSLNDSISTFALLISFTIALFTKINIDGYMGVLVSLMIIYGGYQLIRQTMSPLIGEAPNRDLVKELSADILRHKGVLGIHDMVIHSYGPAKTFMTVHVEVDSEANFIESHDIIDNIEHEFIHKYNINLVIHMDPIDTHCERTSELKSMVADMLLEIDPILQYHDFRIVQGPTHTNLIFDVVMPLKYKKTSDELVSEIKSRVKKKNQKLKAVITVDRVYLGEDIREEKPKSHRKSKEKV